MLTTDDFKNFDPELDEPKIEYTVKYDFSDSEIYQMPRFVVIETDLPGAEMFDFPAFLPDVTLLPKSENWWPRKKRLLLNQLASSSSVARATRSPHLALRIPNASG